MKLTEKLFNEILSIGKGEYDDTWEDFKKNYHHTCPVCGNTTVFAFSNCGSILYHNKTYTVYLTVCMECGAVINEETWVEKDKERE